VTDLAAGSCDQNNGLSHQLLLYSRVIERTWWNETARANRDPIVLLHEGLGSVSLWRDFPETLARATERAVFAYSRAGHGASDPPGVPHTARFMHEEATDRLPAILAEESIERAVLLGHSDGGSIALVFAATNPARVAALILEAAHVFVEDVSIASIERMKREYGTTDLRRRLAKYHTHVDAAFHGWNDVWLSQEFRDWNLEAYLPSVTAPTLVIQGEDDKYGTLRQVDAIARQICGPVETLILPDCGHSPHGDQQPRVLAAIQRFLQSAQVNPR
jgi:pimeloyl-ACP methyl ester carboxylesterase